MCKLSNEMILSTVLFIAKLLSRIAKSLKRKKKDKGIGMCVVIEMLGGILLFSDTYISS